MFGLFLRHARLRSSIRATALCLAGYRSSMSFLRAVKAEERTDVASRTRGNAFLLPPRSAFSAERYFAKEFNEELPHNFQLLPSQLPYLAAHFYELLSSRLYIGGTRRRKFEASLERRARTRGAVTMFVEETGEFANDSFVQRKLKNTIEAKHMWKNFVNTSRSILVLRTISNFVIIFVCICICITLNAIERGFFLL